MMMQFYGPPNVRPYLTTKSLTPENQETPIQFINGNTVGEALFYRRNHFAYPFSYSLFLPIEGSVICPNAFSIQDIYSLPSREIKVLLECSGNKRELFEPKVYGEQWGKGAMSQGVWKGVSLKTLLQYTGVVPTAKEIVFEGYDYGTRPGDEHSIHFSRSLPLEKAFDPDIIIAYAYNHQPIPFKHGFPLRLIVPNWYAMASVKWLKKIMVIDEPFKGPYQSEDYMYYPHKENDREKIPVTTMNVNSTIQYPLDMQILSTGTYEISGIAWTGNGEITRVEISLDGGHTWGLCKRTSTPGHYTWISWTYTWTVDQPGEYSIRTKATDSSGNMQPEKPFWNRKGYGYNAVDVIKVKVE